MMGTNRRRVAILLVLAVGIAAATWAAAPLFTETRSDVPRPEGFTVLVREGTWQGVDDFHFASGIARIFGNGAGDHVMRLENFSVRNGPDIRFFLSADRAVGPGDLELGAVTATAGSYNIPIPRGSNVQEFGYALIHCVPANFLFASAALA